ncbi:tyrosine--tRNA ligase [Candidatus Peregrinibacteria bacterium CG_4_10_14_0_2_um_filter_43_11]|nr:MAG: tyrosine--tRNA ligase [Candidatus Peregrinibacteria bacterium CG_4_10_14_0_2_um_filter_43_11]
MDIHELLTRGVQDIVPKKGLMEKLQKGDKLRLYMGIDPTGSRIHLGHSIPLRKLKAFAEAGHHVIFLIGSFTAMIGDPTGRDAMRAPLTKEQVEANFQTYKKQAGKILDFSKIEIAYNHEWLEKMTFAEIMKLASHFTVQQMLQRDMFKERMKREEDLSPNEFMYPLMQGYDSVMLDVDLEIGGNDQLFNMLAGRKLMKAYKDKEKWVMTTPLIEGLDGRKMSKTYNNTINITDEPGDMFGKVMSMADELIIKYFLLCTDVPLKEIDEVDTHIKQGGNPRDAKIRLAREIITMYHNSKSADQAKEEFVRMFTKGGVPDDMPEFSLNGDREIIDLLILCKLVETKSEGRRALEQGGVKINGEKVDGINTIVHLKKDMIVQVGKRRFAKIV